MHISKGMVAVALVAWCSFVGQCSFMERLMQDNATGKQILRKFARMDKAFLFLRLKSGTMYDFLEGSPQCNDETLYQGTNCVLRQHLFAFDKQTLASLIATAEACPEPPPDEYDLHSYEAIVRVLNVVESVGVTIMCRFANLSMMMLTKPLYSPCEHFRRSKQVVSYILSKFKEHEIPLTPVVELIEIFDSYCNVENPDTNYKNDVINIFATFERKYNHLSGLAKLTTYTLISFKTEFATMEKQLDKVVVQAEKFFKQPESSSGPSGSSVHG